jgi:hypothetical protein
MMGWQGSSESYDQLLILAKIKDQESDRHSAFPAGYWVGIKLPDGSEQVNVAASDKDMDRVFQAYPSLSLPARGPDPSRHHPVSRPIGRRAGHLQLSHYQGTMGYAADGQGGGPFMHQKNLEHYSLEFRLILNRSLHSLRFRSSGLLKSNSIQAARGGGQGRRGSSWAFAR